MKKKQKILLIIILLLWLILIICNIKDSNYVIREKQIIKEMTEGEYESEITQLNKSHKEYALQVEKNKQKLATAISNQKVTTSEDATIDEMVTNIGKILQVGTSDANATADNITAGKTAYVNGELITGTGVDNDSYYNQGYTQGFESGESVTLYLTQTASSSGFDCTSIEGYQNLTADNFIVEIYSIWLMENFEVSSRRTVSVEKSYDASTGMLTLSNYGYRPTSGVSSYWKLYCRVYLVA